MWCWTLACCMGEVRPARWGVIAFFGVMVLLAGLVLAGLLLSIAAGVVDAIRL
jgi:hypothetical protein